MTHFKTFSKSAAAQAARMRLRTAQRFCGMAIPSTSSGQAPAMNHGQDACARARRSFAGFTLIEIIVVVFILGIAALIAVPMLSSAADMQVRAAANRIAADLDYAKGLAVTYQTGYAVVFDIANESYDIRKAPYGAGDIVSNPIRPGSQYIVSFPADSNFSRVNIVNTDFASEAVTFDYLGSPYSGLGIATPLNDGTITLGADAFTVSVDVEPVTGYVTISGP